MARQEWSEEDYFAAKAFWEDVFAQFKPRNDTQEEINALVNALDDRRDELD